MNTNRLFLGLLTATIVVAPLTNLKPVSAADDAATLAGRNASSTIANTKIIALVRWTLDKKGASFKQLTPAEQRNFDTFQNAIANEGLSPKDAASRIGGANYKKLQGTKDQYEIRLSKGTRATFRVDDNNHVVKILEVGGHT